MGRAVWPATLMVIAALAAVTTGAIVGVDVGPVLQVIATAVVPTVTILLVGRHVVTRVDRVEEQVNGRMTELIAKVPDPPDRGE